MESKSEGSRFKLPGRKVLLLAVLVVLTAVAIGFQWKNNSTSQQSASVSKQNQGKDISAGSQDPVLDPKPLRERQPVYKNGKRNLFSFYVPPPPPPPVNPEVDVTPPPPPAAICGNQVCEGGENNQNCPTDCGPPPPPEIQLRYIGYLLEPTGSVVFLTDGKEVFMGRVNDIIANRYRILKITDESVELGYLNLNQSRTIQFQGNGKS